MKTSVLNSNSGDYGKQYKQWVVEAVTADKTLDGDDSGKLFVVNPAATTTLTLPSVSLVGWNCTVVTLQLLVTTSSCLLLQLLQVIGLNLSLMVHSG
jgi:nitrogen fixation/metabolism regulation signal transduction histidine kinase